MPIQFVVTSIVSSKEQRLILIPHRIVGNIYVRELGRAYQKSGHSVIFGPENFFESKLPADIIHLHWPEEQYRAFGEGSLHKRADAFIAVLDQRLSAGAKLVWTVHNLQPHFVNDQALEKRIYQAVIDRADVIHHHCDCSKTLLAELYKTPKETKQVVVPHGHFFAYQNKVSRSAARAKLHIPEKSFVVLQFGSIRRYESLHNVRTAFLKAKIQKKHLLIAGRIETRRSLWQRIMGKLDQRLRSNMTIRTGHVSDDEIQLYFNSADIVILGHTDALNSGIPILAMSFGKPVIGPDKACIGDVLKKGDNIVLSRSSVSELLEGLHRSARLDLTQMGKANKQVAEAWRWTDISDSVLGCFVRPPNVPDPSLAKRDK